jgi:hypothetical protein
MWRVIGAVEHRKPSEYRGSIRNTVRFDARPCLRMACIAPHAYALVCQMLAEYPAIHFKSIPS